MKSARRPANSPAQPAKPTSSANAWTSGRRDWPEPVEMSPVRVPSAAAAFRGPSEQPVRPVPGWRLPSGQLLVEYALRAGLASSPLLMRLPLLGAAKSQSVTAGESAAAKSLASLAQTVASKGVKQALRNTAGLAGPKPVRKAGAGG